MSSEGRSTFEVSGKIKFQLLLWYKDPVLFFKEVFKVDPYPYQEKIIKEFPKLKRIMISSASDSLIGSRFVPIRHQDKIEFLKLEDLFQRSKKHSGDYIEYGDLNGYETLGGDGEWHRILRIQRHWYDGKVYELREPKGRTIVTPNHSVYDDSNNLTTPRNLKSLKTICPAQGTSSTVRICLEYPIENGFYFRPPKEYLRHDGWNKNRMVRAVKHYREHLKVTYRGETLKALLRFFASYISEGSAIIRHEHDKTTGKCYLRYYISITQKDRKWLVKVLDDVNKFHHGTYRAILRHKKKYWQLVIYGKLLYEMVVKYCGKKDTKRVPNFLFSLTPEYQKVFLKQYSSGDGSVYPSYWRIRVSLPNLYYGIILLAKQAGFKVSLEEEMRENDPFKGKRKYWQIRSTHFYHKNKLSKRILDYSGYVYDLEVERIHNFVDAEGLILVHNTGKTFLLAVIALWSALVKSFVENRKYQVVILSGSREQAERVYEYIREALTSNETLYPLVVTEKGKPKILKSYVEFVNGSWIKTFARALTSVQGVHANMVIVDEAAQKELDFFIKDTLRIVPEDGVIILSSSPHEYNCEFVRRWEDLTNYPEYDPQKHPDGWRRYNWTAKECPRTRQKLKEAKALDEETFSIYYEGKPYAKDPNKVVPVHLIRRQSEGIKRFKIDPNSREGLIIFGIDYGSTAGTMLAVLHKVGKEYRLIDLLEWKMQKYEDVQDWIEAVADLYKPDYIFVDALPKGESERTVDRLGQKGYNVTPIFFSQEKSRYQMRMRSLFMLGQVWIPEVFVDLLEELREYEWDTKRGDDRVVALMLGLIDPEPSERQSVFGIAARPISKPLMYRL